MLNEAFQKGKLANNKTRVLPFKQLLSKFSIRIQLHYEGKVGIDPGNSFLHRSLRQMPGVKEIGEQSQDVNNKIADQGVVSVDKNFSQEDLSG